MRKIEFRCKTVDNQWHYGFPIVYSDGSFGFYELEDNPMVETFVEVYKETKGGTLGQYTGLKDKNGTKIFEGDILAFCKGATHSIKVYWDCLGWKFLRNGKRIDGAFECDISSHIRQCEVIGNIYDNPELVNGE